MQIYRFDEEYAIPVAGGAFRSGPITAPGAAVEVSVHHLPAGGRLDSVIAPAVGRRLWCVVSGDGWVTGGDGPERRVGRDMAACWEAAETHACRTDAGLTAICMDGDFEVVARSLLREIVVVDYDPAWPAWFAEICSFVWPAVEDLALRIDHVGSTSVPGLAAKPIIDMDVVLPAEDRIPSVTGRLEALGYRWLGELGVPGRQAYRAPAAQDLPEHHLYVVVEDNRAHLDHWLLRDLLRGDADACRSYGDLKRRNVDLAQGDIDHYGRAKAALVARLLTRARAERGLDPVDYWTPE
jgi:GrpB-like predicted nucleotidyltransferase (UPF0157 family)